jgi:NADH-quinone oxidoreductase subunit L
MENLLYIFLLIPALGTLLSIVLPKSTEKWLSRNAIATTALQLLAATVFIVQWAWHGAPDLNIKEVVLYRTTGYEFYLDFFFDRITAVYLMVGALLTFIIAVYSRTYLHREDGYKRFFNTILFFFFGYNAVIFSGNLETMFIGWEVLGISSFLLIAFYRERYLPVRNAVMVFSIYRIGDVGLLLAMWMSHHLWHANISFLELNNDVAVHEHLLAHPFLAMLIPLLLLVSAAAKSAQLPFSPWLPRAMEGPTPSSAIFYGSLSVHIGVFLMLRTFPFWEEQTIVRLIVGAMGLLTAIIATPTARVQSSIKAQIAYSSIAQIGLIFMEVAAGFETLALVHFAGNAFLRTYQLLVSPSAVTYLIREQFYHFEPARPVIERFVPARIRSTFYVLSLKEWNLDVLLFRLLWAPMKQIGGIVTVVSFRNFLLVSLPALVMGCVLYFNQAMLPKELMAYVPTLFAFIGLTMVMRAFTERGSTRKAWTLVLMNHLWIALAVSFNEHFGYDHTALYLSGILVAFLLGLLTINRLRKLEPDSHLDRFHGLSHRHPKLGMVFLAACLGMAGFPLSPSFVGEDLIFSHIHTDQLLLAFFVASSFIVDGLALIRMYARLFLGPHDGGNHLDQSGDGRTSEGLRTGTQGLRTGTQGLRTGTEGLRTSTEGLRTGTEGLRTGAQGLRTGTEGLHTCTEGLRTGTEGLHTGTEGLHTGTEGLHTGTEGLRTGTEGLRSGAEGSRSGAEGFRSGAEGLCSGAEGLRSGAEGSRSGAERLRSAMLALAKMLGWDHVGALHTASMEPSP